MIRIFVLLLFVLSFASSVCFSQGEIIDDFSKKSLPDWISGGVDMVYSHQEDNKENGYADVLSKGTIAGKGYIGKILLKRSHLYVAGNYINVMLKGVDNDASVKIQVIYDVDNNDTYNEDEDIMLVSEPVSLDFNGWKEIKIKLDQENFKIVSKFQDYFEVTEENAFGLQLEFEAGQNYKSSKFESGIALVSEIQNKEALTEGESNPSGNRESYFNAKNFPNPFNPSTTISFVLPQATYVSLTVYDRLGREVIVLIDQNLDQGEQSVEFNASEYPSGIYFYRIKTPEKTEVRKMLLTK